MATNNKAVITFNRDFILNDKLEILVSSGGLGSLYTFNWVASPSVAFEVEVGTPTGTTGETAAINFKTAWENSVTGFTVTQSTNTVTIVGQDFSFVSIVAKDGSGNSYLIPTDYNVAISTETTGNKITYSDKVGLIPKGTHINQVWDDDMNEIKTKFNLNDDRIGVNETNISQNTSDISDNTTNIATNTANIATNTSNIAGKADLVGGNSFTGGLNSFGSGISTTTIVASGTSNFNGSFNNFGGGFGGSGASIESNGNISTNGIGLIEGLLTVGLAAQANSFKILGDTGEDLTITKNIDGETEYNNTNNDAHLFNGLVSSTKFKLSALNTAPSSASDTGQLGEIRIDANYIYVCVATNTWKRVAIATW